MALFGIFAQTQIRQGSAHGKIGRKVRVDGSWPVGVRGKVQAGHGTNQDQKDVHQQIATCADLASHMPEGDE